MNNTSAVLITGALPGIGRATAFAFARDKARVLLAGRRAEVGEKLAVELRATGIEAEFIQADVRHEEQVEALAKGTVARFGQLDIAVNAAGVEGESGPVTEQTPERYAAVFDANVLGTLLAIKHELRVMTAQQRGSIVNVARGNRRGHRFRRFGQGQLYDRRSPARQRRQDRLNPSDEMTTPCPQTIRPNLTIYPRS